MKETLTIKQFAYLLLATLAKQSTISDPKDENEKMIALPSNYKEAIYKIIKEPSTREKEIAHLINVEEYLLDRDTWEQEFSIALNSILEKMNKKATYDILNDRILIRFKQKEADAILAKCLDDYSKKV